MPLTMKQVDDLSEQMAQEWSLSALVLFASKLGVNLANLATMGTFKERAVIFINHMNSLVPPRDIVLLEALQRDGNASLKAVAAGLLKPTFYSATGDAHDAIVFGKTAFVDRTNLRDEVRTFTNPSPYSTRVLIVRGDEPGGKSYTWEFLRHLAFSTVGALPRRLRLKNTGSTPRQFFEEVGRLLLLDLRDLPALADDPQLALIYPLINWFKGQLVNLRMAYWLVVDDLNDPGVTPAMREAAYALAYAVEEVKPQNLWVALLGYNEAIKDPDFRHVAQEQARFPDARFVAEHFEMIARAGPKPLTIDIARQMADLLFAKYSKLDKEAMIMMTGQIENIGEKLRLGLQP